MPATAAAACRKMIPGPEILELCDKRRERRSLEGLAGGFISDHAGVKVDGNHIALVDGLAGGGAFQNGQADVDGVAVEDTGKALGNHAVNAGGLDGNGDRKSVV